MNSTLVPPGVTGRVRGSFTITIDEVLWSKPQSPVYVKFSWWGSDESHEFFPKDSTDPGAKISPDDKPTSRTFPVGTSMKFLEDYFRKWGCITFNVYRVSDKRLLGSAKVENWECILSETRYGSYFAILDKKDHRIGDLHVVFLLKMKKKKKYKLKSDFPIVRDVLTSTDWDNDGEVLTDLLSKGQQLRKAMVTSVLSSCEPQDLDKVVGTGTTPVETAPVPNEKLREAKLVDFLMGKELSEPDKEIAINTLRCTSPSESVLEVAMNFPENSKSWNANKFDSSSQKFCSVGENKQMDAVDKPQSSNGVTSRIPSRETPPDDHHHAGRDLNVLFERADAFQDYAKKAYDSDINSYKISFVVLSLTALGLKKVSTSPTIRPLNNKIRAAKSPGIVFSIETMVPFTPKSKTPFLKPVTMSSKAFGGNDAVFNDSVLRKLRRSDESAWTKVGRCVAGLPIKIYWRCLNQRLPSLLGQCTLPENLDSDEFEANYQLPVYLANRQVVAVFSCKIELGVSGVFGNDLLGKRKTNTIGHHESIVPQPSEKPPSRSSCGSVKSSRHSKESSSVPIPPPTVRCRTASSATSNTFREPVDSDQQLLDAISTLNEKLTKKAVLPEEPCVDGATEVDSPIKQNQITSTVAAEREHRESSAPQAVVEPPKDRPSEEKSCKFKSPRGCCCCCRGCLGDCKQKKSLKSRRDRHRPSSFRVAEGKEDESSELSHMDDEMSAEGRDRLGLSSRLRDPRFHSPPTRLKKTQFERVNKNSNTRHDSRHSRRHVPSNGDRNGFRHDGKLSSCSPSELPSVHHFVVNVYSSDAQIFYREGELELYMVYRFPQVDPLTGRLFCPAEISTVELSGDSPPVTHFLPLRTSLSEALLSYPKHNVTFHIWARAYLYKQRDFLIGQAKLPLEKLVEWEAAHVYSQKRRIDHPLLPPDKHFINLQIHPAKGELPQHLEHGRIAQLGLEIDYEKFRDTTNAFEAWPATTKGFPTTRLGYPMSQLDGGVRTSCDTNSNFKNMPSRDQPVEPEIPRPLGGFSEKSGNWGVRMVGSLSSTMPSGDKSGLTGASRGQRFCSTTTPPDRDEEFMLILDEDCRNRPDFRSPNDRNTAQPNHQVPNGAADQSNVWSEDKLQFQSFSGMDRTNASEFVPDEDLRAQLLSPRVDRDFPPGVRTADFSSDNNSYRQANPFDAPVTVHHQTSQPKSRIRLADQSSPLPSLAKVIGPNFRAADASPTNLDSSYELGSDSKATQTTVNEQNSPELFSVRIEVESAINLPLVRKDGALVKPTSRIEFDAWNKGKEIVVQSSVVAEDSNPKYDGAWNVELPTHLLYKSDSELELRVINVDEGSVSSAFIDLTTLSAGLPSIEGWFFLSCPGHKSAGQVKVAITPTEGIRKYRDVWIEECRKNKEAPPICRRDERLSCDSAQKLMLNDSSSVKFKEKMKELEQLTERMKKKLLDADRWDSNSPCTLMRDVDHFAKQLLQEVEEPRPGNKGLQQLDLGTVRQFCPTEISETPQRDCAVLVEDSPPPAPLQFANAEHSDRDLNRSCFGYIADLRESRIRKPRKGPLSTASRSISNRVDFITAETASPDIELPLNPAFGSSSLVLGPDSPVNLISFEDSPDERNSHTYSLPSNSNDTSPTSPVNVLIRGGSDKFSDAEDLGAVAHAELDTSDCNVPMDRLPRDSLDAASLAIEKMISDLRNQNVNDLKS